MQVIALIGFYYQKPKYIIYLCFSNCCTPSGIVTQDCFSLVQTCVVGTTIFVSLRLLIALNLITVGSAVSLREDSVHRY